MCPDGFGPKKKPFGFNFRELWTTPDVLVYLNGAKAGLEKQFKPMFILNKIKI